LTTNWPVVLFLENVVMKILFLSKDVLYPLDSGGRIRTSNTLKQISKAHEVDIVSLLYPEDREHIPAMSKLCHRFRYVEADKAHGKDGLSFYCRVAKNLLSPYPYTMQMDTHRDLRRAIEQMAPEYDLLICDFLFPALNCVGVTIPKILFQHNVEYVIHERHAHNARGPMKLMWYLQYLKTQRIERIMANRFDWVICVSEPDAEIHRREFGVETVGHVDLGVDVDEYKSNGVAREPKTLVFTGGMDWRPNEDAVQYFHDDIFPRLNGYTFSGVGRGPRPGTLALARDDFRITGRVDDIKPYLHRADIYVVPLRVGGGTRIKIFEAMAAGVPVVSTTVGAEGLPVEDGKHILLRDDPARFAEAVETLATDRELHGSIVNNAYNLVRDNYSWQKVCEPFLETCERIGSKK